MPDNPDQAPDDIVAASPLPDRAAGRAPSTPRRAAPPAPSSPQGGRGLKDKAFRDAVKAATSALHAAQRTGKGRYRKKDATPRYKPGMAVRTPQKPPGGTP